MHDAKSRQFARNIGTLSFRRGALKRRRSRKLDAMKSMVYDPMGAEEESNQTVSNSEAG